MNLAVPTLVLAAAAGWAAVAAAASPGAYSISETDSSKPGDRQDEVRCLRPEQVDTQGFLVPRQTLAAHDSCQVTRGRTESASTQWSAACAGVMRLNVQQRNSGNDFQIEFSLRTEDKHVSDGRIQATALGRACHPIETAF